MNASAADVSERLRAHYGPHGVRELVPLGELRRWRIMPPGRSAFDVRFTEQSLLAGPEAIERWLRIITLDARTDAPALPGYSLVQAARVSVRGMDVVNFEKHGQAVRCRTDKSAGEGLWRAEVDGHDRGDFMPRSTDDERENVAEKAVEYLERNRLFRIPEPPWQWSVLDDRGSEVWARVTSPREPGWSEEAGRELIFRDRVTGRQPRIPWEEGLRVPTAAELKELLRMNPTR